jgi:hypothetical protein
MRRTTVAGDAPTAAQLLAFSHDRVAQHADVRDLHVDHVAILHVLRLAEGLGFESVWTARAYGSDAITSLAYLAAMTQRIRLGTGIMQLAARPPASAAMAAGTVDALAGTICGPETPSPAMTRPLHRSARLSNLILCIDEDHNCAEADFAPGALVVRFRRRVDAAAVLRVVQTTHRPAGRYA